MRIVVPTTVKVVEASCNRKLQEVFLSSYFQCYLRIILIPIFHVFGHCQEHISMFSFRFHDRIVFVVMMQACIESEQPFSVFVI